MAQLLQLKRDVIGLSSWAGALSHMFWENSVFVCASGLGKTPTTGVPVLQDIRNCLTSGPESFAACQTHHVPAQWPMERLQSVKTPSGFR